MTIFSMDRSTFAITLARWGVIGMAASMPVSRALFNISALLMLIGWIAAGQWTQRWKTLSHSSVAWASFFLFGLGSLNLIAVSDRNAENWGQLLVYSKLLYVPIIMTLLTDGVWLRRAWSALLSGLLITLGVFVMDIWLEVPGTVTYGQNLAGHGVFYHHIAQGMGLAFLGAYGLHKAMSGEPVWQRALWACVALLTATMLIFVGLGRTGQLSVLAAYGLVVSMHLTRRWRVAGLVTLSLIFGTMFATSNIMQQRFSLAMQEMKSYEQTGESTSIGARLKAWELSLNLIKESPISGHGIGSYRSLAYDHFEGSSICDLGVCEQPHNQFLMIAVEAGLPGLLALLFFFAAPLVRRQHSPTGYDPLVPAFIAIVVITAVFDSALSIRPEGFFTVTVLGLLMAGRGHTSHIHQL